MPDETGQLAVAASEEIDPTVAAAEPESESVASEPATPPPLPAPDLTPPAIDRDFVPVQGRAAKRRGHGRLVAGLVVVAVVVVGSLFYLFRDRGDDRLVAPQATTRSSPPSSLETVPEAGSSQSVGEGVGPAESAAGEKAESAAKEEETPDAVAPGPALFSGVDSIDWQRQGGELVVEVSADGAVRSVDYDIVRLERGPPRLLLRIRGVKRDFSQSTLAVRTPEVRQIRMGYHRLATGHEQHLVFDLGSDQVELIGLEDGGPVLRLHFRTGS